MDMWLRRRVVGGVVGRPRGRQGRAAARYEAMPLDELITRRGYGVLRDTVKAIRAVEPTWGRVSANRRESIMALADALKVELASALRAVLDSEEGNDHG